MKFRRENRKFCPDCHKMKYQFQTEQQALLSIALNVDEIRSSKGYVSIRAYHCPVCDCWHTTSHEYDEKYEYHDAKVEQSILLRGRQNGSFKRPSGLKMMPLCTDKKKFRMERTLVKVIRGKKKNRNKQLKDLTDYEMNQIVDEMRRVLYDVLDRRGMKDAFKSYFNLYGEWETHLPLEQQTQDKVLFEYLKNTEPIAWIRNAFDWTINDYSKGNVFTSAKWIAANMAWEEIAVKSKYALNLKLRVEFKSMTPDKIKELILESTRGGQYFNLQLTKQYMPTLFQILCDQIGLDPKEFDKDVPQVVTAAELLQTQIPKIEVKTVGKINLDDINTKSRPAKKKGEEKTAVIKDAMATAKAESDADNAVLAKRESEIAIENKQKVNDMADVANMLDGKSNATSVVLNAEQIKAARKDMSERYSRIESVRKDVKSKCEDMKKTVGTWSCGLKGHADDIATLYLAVDQINQEIGGRLYIMPQSRSEWDGFVNSLTAELDEKLAVMQNYMDSITRAEEEKKVAEEEAKRKAHDEFLAFKDVFHTAERKRHNDMMNEIARTCEIYGFDEDEYAVFTEMEDAIHGKMLDHIRGITYANSKEVEARMTKSFTKKEEAIRKAMEELHAQKEKEKYAKPVEVDMDDDDLELIGKDVTEVDLTENDWVHLVHTFDNKQERFMLTVSNQMANAISDAKYGKAQIALGKNNGGVYVVFASSGTCAVNNNGGMCTVSDSKTLKELFRLLKVELGQPQNWRCLMAKKQNDIRIKFIERVTE